MVATNVQATGGSEVQRSGGSSGRHVPRSDGAPSETVEGRISRERQRARRHAQAAGQRGEPGPGLVARAGVAESGVHPLLGRVEADVERHLPDEADEADGPLDRRLVGAGGRVVDRPADHAGERGRGRPATTGRTPSSRASRTRDRTDAVRGGVGRPVGGRHRRPQPAVEGDLDRAAQLGRQGRARGGEGGERVVVVGAELVVGGHEPVGQLVGGRAQQVLPDAGQRVLEAELAGPEPVDDGPQQRRHPGPAPGGREQILDVGRVPPVVTVLAPSSAAGRTAPNTSSPPRWTAA